MNVNQVFLVGCVLFRRCLSFEMLRCMVPQKLFEDPEVLTAYIIWVMALMVKVVSTSKFSASFLEPVRCHIPKHSHLHTRCYENPKLFTVYGATFQNSYLHTRSFEDLKPHWLIYFILWIVHVIVAYVDWINYVSELDKQRTRIKPIPVPLCPPQIPHGPDANPGLRGKRPATNGLR
jgi:hypothetical protein